MRTHDHRRQVVLFVIAVLVPSLLLIAITIRMLGQERALAEKRRDEAITLRTREFASELLAGVESIKALELGRVSADGSAATVPYPLDPAIALVAWLQDDELVLPWEVDPQRLELPRLLHEPAFARAVAQGEVEEFANGRTALAADRYRAALDHAGHPSQGAYARLMLARALSHSDDDDAATQQFRLLLDAPARLTDEYGVPWMLYAADKLATTDVATAVTVARRLLDFLDEQRWMTPAAGLETLVVAEAVAESPSMESSSGNDLLEQARQRVDRIEKAIELRWQLRELLRAQVEAELAVDRRQPVWVPFGEDPWLVSTLSVSGRTVLLAVDAKRITRLLPAGIGDDPELAASSVELFTSPERPGILLGSSFPGLKVAFSSEATLDAGTPLQGAFVLGALVLVLGLTFVGASFLLRDVRREAHLWEVRSRFVSSVSHELTTPLTSIRMFAETLRMGRLSDPRKRERYLDTIVDESHRLSRLVDNVLDFSKIDRGEKAYRFAWADLGEIVGRAAEAVRHRVEARGIELDVHVGEPLSGCVDADAIEQAILNLLTNAVKYSESHDVVELGLESVNGSAEIRVSDCGPGISAEDHERIFEEFYRCETPENERVPGTGLGLALASHIAEAHGGSIRVDSEPGRGSTFVLQIPLRPAPTPEAPETPQ